MNDIVRKFASLEVKIAEERGDFALFALVLREDIPDRWDLVVAAPWIGQAKAEAVDYLVDEIKTRLGSEELVQLSRIVVADPDDAPVQSLNRALPVEHAENVEIKDSTFFGLPIKHAFVVTSKSPGAPTVR